MYRVFFSVADMFLVSFLFYIDGDMDMGTVPFNWHRPILFKMRFFMIRSMVAKRSWYRFSTQMGRIRHIFQVSPMGNDHSNNCLWLIYVYPISMLMKLYSILVFFKPTGVVITCPHCMCDEYWIWIPYNFKVHLYFVLGAKIVS